MSYSQEDCIRDTKEHISQVREFMIMFANELLQRALVHDQSKLESPEIEIFTEYTPKLKNSTYGSDEYKTYLKEMQVALKHHYENNSHHPEHYKKYICNGCFREYVKNPNPCHSCYTCGYSQFQEESDISQMSLMDIVEMICDWKAATMRHEDGDIGKSIEINQKRFKYSNDLADIFRNTIKLFD
ncbi:hypothetical protein DFO70_11126 [Cytobacillus firmus]|uniref:Uncharacterized protein n=2 Tax=Cytobacillus TaxID=2675230 RepID=A0A366JN69_CYTFI|nr:MULTISPECIES: DUF5662 family protein [Cytobacillus]RBP89379.1 hypothetical protein DFO70_11126 [Cytobacillus firmus]TDX47394.1 hypothetical protein DFO72_101491 [Cytobacillus oceanisediminis]